MSNEKTEILLEKARAIVDQWDKYDKYKETKEDRIFTDDRIGEPDNIAIARVFLEYNMMLFRL